MYGFPMGAVPIDKESLRFMCAWTLLKDTEEESREAMGEWRQTELDALNKTRKDGESPEKAKEREEKRRVIEQTYTNNVREITRTRRKREIKLMRRVAGPLAKLVEA